MHLATHRPGQLCALPRPTWQRNRISTICRRSVSLCLVPVPIVATQALSPGHSLDLLDSLYVSADAGATVLLSGRGSLSFSAIDRNCHSDCVAANQGHGSFAKMES